MRRILVSFILVALGLVYEVGGQEYKTIWRGYIDIYGNSASLPVQFETHALQLVLAYRGVGIGTSVFKLYAKDVTTSNFKDDHKFVASRAPIYLYLIPFASNRKAWDVTPFAMYSFLGGSSWGIKSGKFFDLGLGFTTYLLDFRFGYNTICSASRNPFMNFEDVEDLDDYSVSWNNFYISVSLSTGFWLALSTKSVEVPPKVEQEPLPKE